LKRKLKENPELFENVTDFQIIKNRERLKKNIERGTAKKEQIY
jgi:hypothetical protein